MHKKICNEHFAIIMCPVMDTDRLKCLFSTLMYLHPCVLHAHACHAWGKTTASKGEDSSEEESSKEEGEDNK